MSKEKRRGAKAARESEEAEKAKTAQPVSPANNPFLAHKSQLQGLVKPSPKPQVKAPEVKGKEAKAREARAAWGKAVALKAEAKAPQVSDEDIFMKEMWGVQRIADPAPRITEVPIAPKVRVRLSEEAEVYAELADLVDGSGPWDIADTDEYIEGIAPGLDRRLLQRLRKGEYSVQAHVDLHGMTQEQAHQRVDRFILESRTAGQRCVLIVHGRGLNSKDQIPVLKERVRVWLTRGRIARSVLCFATARPSDGGAGAVYVLLRK